MGEVGGENAGEASETTGAPVRAPTCTAGPARRCFSLFQRFVVGGRDDSQGIIHSFSN